MKFTFVIACLTVVYVAGRVKSDKDGKNEIDELKRELEEQRLTIARLGNNEISLKVELEEQKAAMKTLNELVKKNMETTSQNIEIVRNTQMDQFNELMGYMNNGPRNVRHFDKKQASNGAFHANGCIGDDVLLFCTANRTIFVTHANYGQYGSDYTQPNCAPHPYDCDESVSVTDEDQWIYIKYICDNQTVCSYPFEGSVFDTNCAPGSLVDYISIYYDCLPEPTDEAVGFTAYAPDDISNYDGNDIVIFDSTITNIGGYYQTSSSQFLCPADGMYAFSLHIMTGGGAEFLGAIMKESVLLDSVWGDNMSGYYNGVSNFVITACSKGERVWVRCSSEGDAMYENVNNRYNTFSGFLLHRL